MPGSPDSAPTFDALGRWFAAHCDGEWEHAYGVSITSTDNPGWWMKVDLTGTALAGRSFTPMRIGVDESKEPIAPSWLCCEVRDGIWHGAGDPTRLPEIVRRFLDWAEAAS
jgi:Immunity protein 53